MTPLSRAFLAYVALAVVVPIVALTVYDACVETTEAQP